MPWAWATVTEAEEATKLLLALLRRLDAAWATRRGAGHTEWNYLH